MKRRDFIIRALLLGLMIAAALSPQALAVPVPETVKCALRARIMRCMLLNIARRNQRTKQPAATALIRIERSEG